MLVDYAWPGNVRELENVIERAVVLCRGDTLARERSARARSRQAQGADAAARSTFPVGTPLDEVERRLIRETLRHAKGDKSLAAQLLGISTRTIYRKLRRERARDEPDAAGGPGVRGLVPVWQARPTWRSLRCVANAGDRRVVLAECPEFPRINRWQLHPWHGAR